MDVSIGTRWIDPECRSSACHSSFLVFDWIVYIIHLVDGWAWSMWIILTDPNGLIHKKILDDVLVWSRLDHVSQPNLDWSIRVSGLIFLDRSRQFITITCLTSRFSTRYTFAWHDRPCAHTFWYSSLRRLDGCLRPEWTTASVHKKWHQNWVLFLACPWLRP